MPYLLGAENEPGCLFCRVFAAPLERDRDNLVLLRRPNAFVMLNRYPYVAGHIMVAPVAHVAAPDDLAEPERSALGDVLLDGLARLRRAVRPDGLNLGMNIGQAAGAGIADHCHWHIVPRFSGDANFITAVGEVRVVPEMLSATYDRLKPFFE